MLKLNLSLKVLLKILKLVKTVDLNVIKKKDPDTCKTNMVGKKMILLKSGLLDPKIKELTCWLIPLKESNSCLKSEIPWRMLSNGPPKKPSWPTKIWDLSELILWTLFSIPMLSIEEVVKSSPLPEESIMLVNWALALHSKNLFSRLKSLLLLTVWEEFTIFSIKEEVLFKKKNKLLEPPVTSSEPIYPSLNLSDSPPLWEELPLDKLSPNVSFPTGLKFLVIH